ncbi:hypothetical protein HMPREF9135_1149 [Segatella baroniae F0067]|uniref:Uncharacterized protein n=1 Tax=Segatella baroniae F0067 TaxID=1115809 RepID=U2P4P2_9BACT|nr:hypothetical protein HMPREF9135_1149 [Segatella baroniae F0067]
MMMEANNTLSKIENRGSEDVTSKQTLNARREKSSRQNRC